MEKIDNSGNSIELAAVSVTYFSSGDEDAFFTWLASIPCVKKFEGHFRTLYITIDKQAVDDDCIEELKALFIRYNIPYYSSGLYQLETLGTALND